MVATRPFPVAYNMFERIDDMSYKLLYAVSIVAYFMLLAWIVCAP